MTKANISEIAHGMALVAHFGQGYGMDPYSYHLEEVVNVAKEFGYTDQEMLAVCWLHDSLEDTALSPELIYQLSPNVLEAVQIVTDPKRLPTENRLAVKQKMNERFSRLNMEVWSHKIAVLAKLCDRVANMRRGLLFGSTKVFEMYKSEYSDFKKALYRPGFFEDLWKELDKVYESMV